MSAFEVHGELGEVPADVATPLAVVLAELVQNAVEHAFAELDDDDGVAPTTTTCSGLGRQVRPSDLVDGNSSARSRSSTTGRGLPEDFDIDASESLGLSIVRDLVRSQLDGTIVMRNRSASDGGQTGTVGGHRAAGPRGAADRSVSRPAQGGVDRLQREVGGGRVAPPAFLRVKRLPDEHSLWN